MSSACSKSSVSSRPYQEVRAFTPWKFSHCHREREGLSDIVTHSVEKREGSVIKQYTDGQYPPFDVKCAWNETREHSVSWRKWEYKDWEFVRYHTVYEGPSDSTTYLVERRWYREIIRFSDGTIMYGCWQLETRER